jgi:glycosyltransferase involved in cell wall biosynthesis
MKTDPPLLLFYASRQIGGGEAYFINLGLAAIRSGRRCIVVDYDDGYVLSRIPGAEHVSYSDDCGASYQGDCVAFMPLGALVFLGCSLRLRSDTRILLVSVHHHHAIELGNLGWLLRRVEPGLAGKIWPLLEPLRHRTIKRLFREMNARSGLAYCAPFQRRFDETYLELALNSPVISIPAPRRKQASDTRGTGGSIIWVSRFAKEKAKMIFDLIAAVAASRCGRKLILIGDGPERERIAEEAKAAGIPYEMPGLIAGSDLDSYIKSNALVCVGVGTTAIEMAVAGLPTLVVGLPGSHRGKFLWLHHTEPGDTVIAPAGSVKTLSLNSAIAQIADADGWIYEARACMEAASSRHDIECSWNQLSKALGATSLTVSDACRLARMDQQPFALIRTFKLAIRAIFSRKST